MLGILTLQQVVSDVPCTTFHASPPVYLLFCLEGLVQNIIHRYGQNGEARFEEHS